MVEEDLKKINYLNSFIEAKIECDRIGYVLESYRELERSAKGAVLDTVSSKSKRDMSDYIERVEEKEKELIEAMGLLQKNLADVNRRISEMENQDERMILTERFIKRRSMNDIAWEYHYSRRSLYRLYKRAIKNFRIL